MSGSLSHALNIKVNGYSIILDEILDEGILTKHKINRLGFVQRNLLKLKGEAPQYWSKNCELSYLDSDGDEFSNRVIAPVLNVDTGANIMFGTSAYFWCRDNRLIKFTYQIIHNSTLAEALMQRFEDDLNINLNTDKIDYNPDTKVWSFDDQVMVLEYPNDDNKHGYIHLGLAR